jgi:hypothetical protein
MEGSTAVHMMWHMTGPEIAAVGKALEVAGNKILGQDEKTKEQLSRLAEDTPEMKAAARTRAARIAAKERIKLRFMQPLAYVFGVGREYFEDKFLEEMAAKTSDVPVENVVAPPPSVAVPAMQALSYSFEEPALKEMYLNLLAAASDDRRSDEAHPAFAEIIRQLNPKEAVALNVFLQSNFPIVNLKEIVDENGNFRIRCRNLTQSLFVRNGKSVTIVTSNPAWIDNWERLGLVELNYLEFIIGDSAYEWVTTHQEYVWLKADESVRELEISKGILRPTDFGRLFFSAVSTRVQLA